MVGGNEFAPGEAHDSKMFYPVNPQQLPKELHGVVWPPKVEIKWKNC
jgi:hypothetical protein